MGRFGYVRVVGLLALLALLVGEWGSEPALAQEVGPRDDLVRRDLATAALLAAVAGWLAFLVLRARFGGRPAGERALDASPGDDHDRDGHDGDDHDGSGGESGRLRLPDDPPAVAAALSNGGAVTASALGAIVLDLARRGYLRIVEEGLGFGEPERPGEPSPSEEDRVDWRLERRETPGGDLRPYENAVFARLFGVAHETRFSSLVEWAGSNRQQAATFLDRIRRYVSAELHERGYADRGGVLPAAVNVGTGGVVALLGLLALVNGSPLGLVALGSGVVQLALTPTLRRRAISGSRRAREWAEVRRALEAADERIVPLGDPEAWERSLVYACALGVVEPFLDGLRRHGSSPPEGEFRLATWYEGAGSTHRLESVGRFTDTFGRVLEEAASGTRGSASSGPAVRRLSAWASRSR